MRAMVFAAGLGTRLRPLTAQVPKCLVTAGGKPLLQHVLERLKDAGVDSVVINLHHLGDQVRAFMAEHDQFDLEVHYSEEAELLETGGGLLQASPWFEGEDDFLVINSDIWTDLDLTHLLYHHRNTNALATLAVATRQTSRYLHFDEELNLTGWESQRTGENIHWGAAAYRRLAFNGIHVMRGAMIPYLRRWSGAFGIIPVYLELAQAGELISGFHMANATWFDVGTQEKLETLREFLGNAA